MFSLSLLLSIGSANATSYVLEIPIANVAPPTTLTGTAEDVVFGRHIKDVADGQADQVVTFTGSPISCEIKDGDLYFSVVLNTASWPTTAPTAKVCTLGGNSVTVTPVFAADETAWLTGDDTATPSTTLAVDRAAGWAGRKGYALATGFSYEAKTVAARLANNTVWTGVNCYTFNSNEGWVLGLEMSASASAGVGFCKIGKVGAGDYSIDLDIAAP